MRAGAKPRGRPSLKVRHAPSAPTHLVQVKEVELGELELGGVHPHACARTAVNKKACSNIRICRAFQRTSRSFASIQIPYSERCSLVRWSTTSLPPQLGAWNFTRTFLSLTRRPAITPRERQPVVVATASFFLHSANVNTGDSALSAIGVSPPATRATYSLPVQTDVAAAAA